MTVVTDKKSSHGAHVDKKGPDCDAGFTERRCVRDLLSCESTRDCGLGAIELLLVGSKVVKSVKLAMWVVLPLPSRLW